MKRQAMVMSTNLVDYCLVYGILGFVLMHATVLPVFQSEKYLEGGSMGSLLGGKR